MASEDQEKLTRKTPIYRRQFSIQAILVVTAMLAILFALWRLDPDAVPVFFLIFFLSGLLGAAFVSLALGISYWRIGGAGGVVCTALIFWSLRMRFISERQLESLGVGFFVATTILVLDLWALWRARSQGVMVSEMELPADRIRLQRAAAARYSLAAVGTLVLLLLVPFEHNDDLIEIVAYVLLLLTPAPWFVAWRQRRLAGYVYPESRFDQVARRLLQIATPLAIASWLLLFLLLAMPASSGGGWHAITILAHYALIFGGIFIFHSIGLAMFVSSLAIQWYRNRWWRLGNLLTLAYVLLFMLGFLTVSYFYAW